MLVITEVLFGDNMQMLHTYLVILEKSRKVFVSFFAFILNVGAFQGQNLAIFQYNTVFF